MDKFEQCLYVDCCWLRTRSPIMATVHLYIDIGTYNILNRSCNNFQARLSRDSSQLSSLSYIKLVSGWHLSPASLPLNHFPCFIFLQNDSNHVFTYFSSNCPRYLDRKRSEPQVSQVSNSCLPFHWKY